MDDFNTATFPSEKYYDLEKWARKEKKRQELQLDPLDGSASNDLLQDEEQVKNERLKRRQMESDMLMAQSFVEMDDAKKRV